MGLDLFHAEAVTGTEPVGMVTSGGTGSITHAMLAYREHGTQERGVTHPNVVKPETAHPAFDKACHLFGIELRVAPIDPDTTQVDVEAMASLIDDQTLAIVGSACNYGYGTVDPIEELGRLALDRGVGLHVDCCLGGFILPFGQQLGYDIPLFDFRVPGVTTISADTHKYGYALKGTSILMFADKALPELAVLLPRGLERREVHVAGHGGIPLVRAHGRHLGLDGLARPRGLPAVRAADLRDVGPDAGRRALPPRAAAHRRTDVPVQLHLRRVRHLPRERLHAGSRVAVQRPAVPERAAHGGHPPPDRAGVVEAFATDLADGVAYALEHKDEAPRSGAVYGGVAGGLTDEADEFIKGFMSSMLDTQQSVPS